jgi:glucose-1-phosphate adenylyltransferase
MILAGGEGKRLYPLTRDRAKPAVPFGGRYRLIDFVLSNFVNSGVNKMSVLTQYKAGSLMQHLARGWQLAPQLGHYVAPVPATMNLGPRWFMGSADAVFQNLDVIENEAPRHVAVFSADHIYKMDVRQMLAFHQDSGALATVAVIPVPVQDMDQYGIVECDAAQRVTGFLEKPPVLPGVSGTRLASMGLYVFTTDALVPALTADAELPDSKHDFGRDILPRFAEAGTLFAYDLHQHRAGGRRRSSAATGATSVRSMRTGRRRRTSSPVTPAFSLYNPAWPIYRSAFFPSPPAKFVFADKESNRVGIATDSMVSEGCIISGGHVDRSILGLRVRVNSYSDVAESILFDDVDVGRHVRIRRAIIDKGVRIPPGTEIGYDLEADRQRFAVSEGGVVVVPKGMSIPPRA